MVPANPARTHGDPRRVSGTRRAIVAEASGATTPGILAALGPIAKRGPRDRPAGPGSAGYTRAMTDDAEARVRAALAAGAAPSADDVAAVLGELAHWREVAAERWTAIGALAPKAKELRLRSQDLERAIAAARDLLERALQGGGRVE
jgi:hypothetical protein